MRKLFCLLFLFLVCNNVFASKTLVVQESCVKLNDIYPQLSDREITCKLNYGDERRISKERLKHLLSAEGITNAPVSDVRVRRYGVPISNKTIEVKVFDALQKKYPNHRLEIEKIKIHNRIFTGASKQLDVQVSGDGFGSIYATVSNGIKTYRIFLYVRAYASVKVTTSRVRKGELFTSKYEQKEMDVTTLRYEAVKDPENYIAGRNISQNKIISVNAVVPKPVNFAGDHVSLIYQSKAIRIATVGELEENAYIGKKVRVKNNESGKYVHAKAVAENKFIVTF